MLQRAHTHLPNRPSTPGCKESTTLLEHMFRTRRLQERTHPEAPGPHPPATPDATVSFDPNMLPRDVQE